jgi:hypothetical protein
LWNKHWGGDKIRDWTKRLRKLWTGISHPQTRITVWRVLQEGYYNNVRGYKMEQVQQKVSTLQQWAETTEHLFFSCEGPIKRWEKLLQVLEQTDFNINDCTSLFEIIGLAIDKSKRSPTLLIIVAETLLACWKDRVKWSF